MLQVIAGMDDFSVIAYDANTFQSVLTFNGHTDSVLCVKTINSQLIASGAGSRDNTAKIWNLLTESLVFTLTHPSSVLGLEYLSTGYLVRSLFFVFLF